MRAWAPLWKISPPDADPEDPSRDPRDSLHELAARSYPRFSGTHRADQAATGGDEARGTVSELGDAGPAIGDLEHGRSADSVAFDAVVGVPRPRASFAVSADALRARYDPEASRLRGVEGVRDDATLLGGGGRELEDREGFLFLEREGAAAEETTRRFDRAVVAVAGERGVTDRREDDQSVGNIVRDEAGADPHAASHARVPTGAGRILERLSTGSPTEGHVRQDTSVVDDDVAVAEKEHASVVPLDGHGPKPVGGAYFESVAVEAYAGLGGRAPAAQRGISWASFVQLASRVRPRSAYVSHVVVGGRERVEGSSSRGHGLAADAASKHLVGGELDHTPRAAVVDAGGYVAFVRDDELPSTADVEAEGLEGKLARLQPVAPHPESFVQDRERSVG